MCFLVSPSFTIDGCINYLAVLCSWNESLEQKSPSLRRRSSSDLSFDVSQLTMRVVPHIQTLSNEMEICIKQKQGEYRCAEEVHLTALHKPFLEDSE